MKMTTRKWYSHDDKSFSIQPRMKEYEKLSPGYYDLRVNAAGIIYFDKINDISDDILRFKNDSVINEAVKEINSFWKKKEFFKKHNFSFKRGILLHGPQGTGKSCAIKMICEDIKNLGGIALNVRSFGIFVAAMRKLRTINPDIPVVAIIEDIDHQLDLDEANITNTMDGLGGFDNVVYLATTNYLSKISPRIRNRPSRFDRRFRIGFPSFDVRKEYFEHLAEKSGIGKEFVSEFAEKTEDLSFAHMKEVFISVIGFESSVDTVVSRIREMGQVIKEDELDEPDKDNREIETETVPQHEAILSPASMSI